MQRKRFFFPGYFFLAFQSTFTGFFRPALCLPKIQHCVTGVKFSSLTELPSRWEVKRDRTEHLIITHTCSGLWFTSFHCRGSLAVEQTVPLGAFRVGKQCGREAPAYFAKLKRLSLIPEMFGGWLCLFLGEGKALLAPFYALIFWLFLLASF